MLSAKTTLQLPKQFREKHRVSLKDRTLILDGEHFSPALFGFNGVVPTMLEYRFFMFVNPDTPNTQRRIYECRHEVSDNATCGLTQSDSHKFFNHLRIHSQEKPFKCQYPGCNSAFA